MWLCGHVAMNWPLNHNLMAYEMLLMACSCGSVAMQLCNCVAIKLCDYVVMWLCGYVAMWLCGYVAIGSNI